MPTAAKKRTKKPRAAAQHPKYADMIIAALSGMKERGGTSRQKIIKYIGANYKVGNGFEVQVRLAIKRMLKAKQLIQVKGTGAAGSFRLSAKATKKPTRTRRSLKKRGRKAKRGTAKRKSSATRKRKARKATTGKKRRSLTKRSSAKKPRTQSKRKTPKKSSRGRKSK